MDNNNNNNNDQNNNDGYHQDGYYAEIPPALGQALIQSIFNSMLEPGLPDEGDEQFEGDGPPALEPIIVFNEQQEQPEEGAAVLETTMHQEQNTPMSSVRPSSSSHPSSSSSSSRPPPPDSPASSNAAPQPHQPYADDDMPSLRTVSDSDTEDEHGDLDVEMTDLHGDDSLPLDPIRPTAQDASLGLGSSSNSPRPSGPPSRNSRRARVEEDSDDDENTRETNRQRTHSPLHDDEHDDQHHLPHLHPHPEPNTANGGAGAVPTHDHRRVVVEEPGFGRVVFDFVFGVGDQHPPQPPQPGQAPTANQAGDPPPPPPIPPPFQGMFPTGTVVFNIPINPDAPMGDNLDQPGAPGAHDGAPPAPPFWETLLGMFGPGGMAAFGGEEPEDPERAKRLVDGLEEVPAGLIKRLERVGGDGNEGQGAQCAICWEPLKEEGSWEAVEKEKETEVKDTEMTDAATESGAQPSSETLEPSTSSVPSTSTDSSNPHHSKIVALPCSHVFHASCLLPWFTRPHRTTCPSCRFDIDPESLTYVPRMPNFRRRPPRAQAQAGQGVPAGVVPQAPAPTPFPAAAPVNAQAAPVPSAAAEDSPQPVPADADPNHPPQPQPQPEGPQPPPAYVAFDVSMFFPIYRTPTGGAMPGAPTPAEAQGGPQTATDARPFHPLPLGIPLLFGGGFGDQPPPPPPPPPATGPAEPQANVAGGAPQPQPHHQQGNAQTPPNVTRQHPRVGNIFGQFMQSLLGGHRAGANAPTGNAPAQGPAPAPQPQPAADQANANAPEPQPQVQPQPQAQPQPAQPRQGAITAEDINRAAGAVFQQLFGVPLPAGVVPTAGAPQPQPQPAANAQAQPEGPPAYGPVPPPPTPQGQGQPHFHFMPGPIPAGMAMGGGVGVGGIPPNFPPFAPFPTGRPRPPRNRDENAPPKPQWALPPAPGPTLRQRVEKRERELGLRCSDISCGLGPTDEDPDPLAGVDVRTVRQVGIRPVLDKLNTTTEPEGAGKEHVCEHRFHPSCLVSAERVAGWGGEDKGVEVATPDGDVEVSCPVCRAVGCVSKTDWEEGACALA